MVQAPRRPEQAEEITVHVCPMRRRHLRAVLRIESQVYPRPWSIGLFMSELALRNSRAYFVARVDGSVVGYGGLMLVADEGHINTLAVDPAWHRRGIGTRLLLTLANEAIARKATSLTLEVRVSNAAAQELYRRFGFVPAGMRRKYYVETNEDALVMWAHDVNRADYRRRLAAIESAIPGLTVTDEGMP